MKGHEEELSGEASSEIAVSHCWNIRPLIGPDLRIVYDKTRPGAQSGTINFFIPSLSRAVRAKKALIWKVS